MTPIDVIICGLDELPLHRSGGVTHVVSILDPGEGEPEEFALWDAHQRLPLRFNDVIEEDLEDGMAPPTLADVERVLEFGRRLPPEGEIRVLVHCHAGMSRSTASALLLLAQREPARDPHAIMAHIVDHRPIAWPNLRIVEMGDRLLGREGRLVEAARRHYRAVAAARPDFAEEIRAGGRGREVDE